MALKNLLKSIFGGGGEPAGNQAKPEDNQEYKQFTISPAPIAEGSQFRTAGTISRDQDGETKSSAFVRADNHSSRDAAVEHSISKAKQIIDEQGENLLAKSHC